MKICAEPKSKKSDCVSRLDVRNRQPRAFTLVEVLTVIAIIALLVTLFFPAVQASREAAGRTRCGNNLRQIGLALQSYHDSKGTLPAGISNCGSWQWDTPDNRAKFPDFVTYNHTGWVLLLPYLEQGALYDQYDFTQPSSTRRHALGAPLGGDGTSNANSDVISQLVEVYACPSDAVPGTVTFQKGLRFELNNARRSNYLFASGQLGENSDPYDVVGEFGRKAGPFGHHGAASFAQITDGLSQTIAVGESKQGGEGIKYDHIGAGPFWGAGSRTCCLGLTPGEDYGEDFRRWAINAKQDGLHQSNGFSSYHPGGAQFVFCDGSVRFIRETIAHPTVFLYMNRIQDGQALAGF